MQFERVRVNKPRKIPAHEGSWTETSIIGDEIIQEIAREGKANVFISDEAAAAIMCSTKCVYSWDVCIKKFMGMIFIDKRDEEGAQNMLDMQTVAETALPDYTPIDDDSINGVR